MFRLIKQVFTVLLSFSGSLATMVNLSYHTKWISVSNQPCLASRSFIDLNPDEWNQEMCYHPFIVNLDKFNGSCNTLVDISSRIYIWNKNVDANLNVFNMITGIDEWKTLTRHKSCKCKCKLDGRKCYSNQKWNNDELQRECKNPRKHHVCGGKNIVGIPVHVFVKMVNI